MSSTSLTTTGSSTISEEPSNCLSFTGTGGGGTDGGRSSNSDTSKSLFSTADSLSCASTTSIFRWGVLPCVNVSSVLREEATFENILLPRCGFSCKTSSLGNSTCVFRNVLSGSESG